MVDAGQLVAGQIRHVSRVFLRIHADNPVRFPHVRGQVRVGEHLNMKGVQHFGGAQPVYFPVVAEGSLHAVNGQQLLKPKGRGNRVRVREIVGLDVHAVSPAQREEVV